jgi:hypothetical protein
MRLGEQISVQLTNPRRYSIKKGESRFKKREFTSYLRRRAHDEIHEKKNEK